MARSSSEWTAASVRDPEPAASGKRDSVAGFDAEVFKNIRPSQASGTTGGCGGADAAAEGRDAWRTRPGDSSGLTRGNAYGSIGARSDGGDGGDGDSEGSHYDDDDLVGGEVCQSAYFAPTQSADSTYSRPGLSLTEPDAEYGKGSGYPEGDPRRQHSVGSFGNGSKDSGLARDAHLASPPVPQRTSSFNRDEEVVSPNLGHSTSPQARMSASGWTSLLFEDVDRSASKAVSRRPSLALHSSQIPLRRSSSEILRSSDYRRHGRASTDTVELREGLGISSGSSDSPEKRAVMTSHDNGVSLRSTLGEARRGPSTGEESPAKDTFQAPQEAPTSKPSSRGEALQAVSEDPVKSPRHCNKELSPGGTSRPDSLPRPDSRDSEPNSEEQAKLERELLAGDTSEGGARPKTLKEARERARLRWQQSEAAASPQVSSASKDSAPGEVKPPRRTEALVGDALPRRSVDSVDRPSRDPRRLSGREVVPLSRSSTVSGYSAPSDYSHGSEAEVDTSFQDAVAVNNTGSRASFEGANDGGGPMEIVEPASAVSQTSAGIEELTAAVSSAMQDLSFGSTDESSNTIYGAVAKDGSRQLAAGSQLPCSDQDLRTPKPTASSRFDDAGRLAASTGQVVAQDPAGLALASPYGERQPPNAATSLSLQSAVREEARPVEARPIIRIEIYGRTVAFPGAFLSQTVTGKKKAAPWERAKLYAQFTNELLTLQTGLELWMDAVQRPAKRQQLGRQSQDTQTAPNEPDFCRTHVRNKGSYAASVRSDMTFPMRGDGGKAKELVSTLPTMPESPPGWVPANLPYPLLVDQRPNSNSNNSSFATSSVSQPLHLNHEAGSSHTVAKSSGLTSSSSSGNSRSVTGGNFFSSLGRKGSRRAPGGSVSSIAQGGLASIAGAVGGPSRSRAKGKTISAPIPLANERRSIDAADVGGADAGNYGRTSGLGESTSASRLPTVSERQNYASSPTVTSPMGSRPSPMGPRAPGSGSGPGFFSSVGRSSSNDINRASAGGSQASPAGAFQPPRVSNDGGGAIASSPVIASPEMEQPYWGSDAQQRPKNGRSSSSGSLLGGSRGSAMSAVRSSFSYGTVRERIRGVGLSSPDPSAATANDPGFKEALSKLSDVLPDADTETLAYYLKKTKGNDLVAIGDYLQDQSLGRLPV